MTIEECISDFEDTNALMVELIKRVVGLTEETRNMVEEVHREVHQTRRIWIAFARRHCWPEDLEEESNGAED